MDVRSIGASCPWWLGGTSTSRACMSLGTICGLGAGEQQWGRATASMPLLVGSWEHLDGHSVIQDAAGDGSSELGSSSVILASFSFS